MHFYYAQISLYFTFLKGVEAMKKFKSEAEYQNYLKQKKIPLIFGPDCDVNKNDPLLCRQGVPDLSVVIGPKHAYLEVKITKDAEHQPNQDYYIDRANKTGGFGRFIYPENEKEVLKELKEFMDK